MSEKQTGEQREVDRGVETAVSSADLPKLTVRITDDTEGFIEGKAIKLGKGDTFDLDFPAATQLVLIGHAEVVGSVAAKAKK